MNFNSILINPLVIILIIFALGGCAASYSPINPEVRKYRSGDSLAPVSFMYRYDVLSLRGNKRYSKKELKNGLNVVAVRITNNTDSIIHTSDLRLFYGSREIIPVNPEVAAMQLKQGTAIYLLYCLLGLYITNAESTGYGVQEKTTFIPIGIPIAAGNMIGAGAANKNLKKEFLKYDINNKDINPHETLYGIITLKETGHEVLTLK
jgi:hypothetical protein